MEVAAVTGVINVFLIALLGFFVRGWVVKVDKTMENSVSEKSCLERKKVIEKKTCAMKTENDKLWRHHHAESGEVIIP